MGKPRRTRKPIVVEDEVIRPRKRSDGDISWLGFMVMVLGIAGLIAGWKAVLFTAMAFGALYLFGWVMKMLSREG